VSAKDGDIEVFGRGTPVIYINGRKMQDQMELQRLQPSDIKNIEVISNPGARYDASVKSVIRITTKKPQGEGFSFDNSTSFVINEDKRMSYYESFQGNYRKGGFDITGFLYGAYTHQPDNKRIQQYTYTGNTWLQDTKITQEYINLNPYARLNASYMFDDENSIGASFSYDRYARKEGRGLQQAMSYCNDQLVETSRGDYFSPGHTSKYLANAYYVGKIGALKIDFNTDYYWYGDKNRMTIKESVTGEDNQIKNSQADSG
jgi:hypothetical protein